MKLVSKHGKVKGLGEYKVGSEVVLTVTPDSGYTFVEWSDGVKDNPRTITVHKGENKYTPMYAKVEEPKVEEPVITVEDEPKPKKVTSRKKVVEPATEE